MRFGCIRSKSSGGAAGRIVRRVDEDWLRRKRGRAFDCPEDPRRSLTAPSVPVAERPRATGSRDSVDARVARFGSGQSEVGSLPRPRPRPWPPGWAAYTGPPSSVSYRGEMGHRSPSSQMDSTYAGGLLRLPGCLYGRAHGRFEGGCGHGCGRRRHGPRRGVLIRRGRPGACARRRSVGCILAGA